MNEWAKREIQNSYYTFLMYLFFKPELKFTVCDFPVLKQSQTDVCMSTLDNYLSDNNHAFILKCQLEAFVTLIC